MSDFDEFQAEHPDEAKAGGSGFLKFCLVCGCLVALLGVGAAVAGVALFRNMFFMDPVKVEQNLKEILPSEVPEGYQGLFGMSMAGVKMSVVGPAGSLGQPNQKLMIVVFQLPPGQDPELAKQQIQQQLQQQGRGAALQQVESEDQLTLTVRGEEVTAQQAVGVGNDGNKMRQVVLVLPRAKDDPTQVLLMFLGNAEAFDEEAMKAFLASIR